MAIVTTPSGVELEHLWRLRGATTDVEARPDDHDEVPILLIQGMGGTIHSWGEPFLDALATGADLVRFGHRGVGRSTRVEEQFTIGDLADDAVSLLDALGLERAHVVSASLGGTAAQALVLAAPERVATLTLGCTYPGGPGAKVMSEETVRKLFGARLEGVEAAIRASWEVNLSEKFREADVDGSEFQRFLEMATRAPVAVPVIIQQATAAGGHDVQAKLPSIAAPTLVIHGTEDEILPFVNGEIIAEAIPDARFEIFPEVGHLWWWEQPERSARLILDHIERAGSGGGS